MGLRSTHPREAGCRAQGYETRIVQMLWNADRTLWNAAGTLWNTREIQWNASGPLWNVSGTLSNVSVMLWI